MLLSVKQEQHYRQVVRLVNAVGRLTNPQHLPVLSEERISLSQLLVLDALESADDSVRMTELARLSGLTATELSRVVPELEDREFLLRKKDPNDSRGRLVALTPAGRRLQRSVERQATADLRDVWDDFTHDEWHRFIDFLARLEAGLRRSRQHEKPQPRGRRRKEST
jgi:DNA-binding MarR family transcriptional regulator